MKGRSNHGGESGHGGQGEAQAGGRPASHPRFGRRPVYALPATIRCPRLLCGSTRCCWRIVRSSIADKTIRCSPLAPATGTIRTTFAPDRCAGARPRQRAAGPRRPGAIAHLSPHTLRRTVASLLAEVGREPTPCHVPARAHRPEPHDARLPARSRPERKRSGAARGTPWMHRRRSLLGARGAMRYSAQKHGNPLCEGVSDEAVKGFEPSTFCMASGRSAAPELCADTSG